MRFVIAGLGFGEQHLRWLAECPAAVIAGLYVRRRTAQSDAVADRFGVAHVATDLRALIDTARADAVVVVTPPESHPALLHTALDAGLLAVSDKPLSADVASACALAEATRHTPGRGVVTFQWRQHPGIRSIRALLQAGALGQLSHLELRFHHDFLAQQETGTPWRHDATQAGAGTLGDQGVHLFDLLRYVTAGDWIAEAARGQIMWPERTHGAQRVACGTEDVADVALRSAAGAQQAFVHVSRVAAGIRALQIRVFGTAGSIDFNVHPDTGTGSLRHVPVGGDAYVEDFVAPSLNPYPALVNGRGETMAPAATFADGLAAQIVLEDAVALMKRRPHVETA